MSERPSNVDGGPETKKSEKEKLEETRQECSRVQELHTVGTMATDEKKTKKRKLPLQQKCLEVKVFERRIIETDPNQDLLGVESENVNLRQEIERLANQLQEEKSNNKKRVDLLEQDLTLLQIEKEAMKIERETMKVEGEEAKKMAGEVPNLIEDVRKLQSYADKLKKQKLDITKKYEKLKEKMESKRGADEKEMEKMKSKIKKLMSENEKLLEEKEAKDKMNEKALTQLSEENKKLKEEVNDALMIRLSLISNLEACEASKAQVETHLEWYRKGWLAFHEYARDQINSAATSEYDILPRESIPMPPEEHTPMRMTPSHRPYRTPSYQGTPNYGTPYYCPSPFYNTPRTPRSAVSTPLYYVNPPPPPTSLPHPHPHPHSRPPTREIKAEMMEEEAAKHCH